MGKELDSALAGYKATLAEHERARDALHAAALDAWRAGWRPGTIAERTELAPGYVRKLAREAGLPPSPSRGPRTRAERDGSV